VHLKSTDMVLELLERGGDFGFRTCFHHRRFLGFLAANNGCVLVRILRVVGVVSGALVLSFFGTCD
jgi:hypothetical protein